MNTSPSQISNFRFQIASLLLLAGLAGAQTNVIGPDDVVTWALAHSPSLKVTREDYRAASARRIQADAGQLPRLDAQGQAQHYDGLENRPLGAGVVIPVIENQYAASLALIQPLYTGGRVSAQKRGMRFAEEASLRSHAARGATLALETLTAYWQWSQARAQIAAYEAAVTRMNALAKDTKNAKEAGLATDNELLSAEVSADECQLQLDDAKRREELGRVTLTRLTGRVFSEECVPVKPDPGAAIPFPAPREAIACALTNREELAALRLAVRAGDERITASRAEARPQLSLIARYEYGRPNMRDFPPDDTWRDDTMVGAAMTWNLFDGGLTRARTAEARAQADRDRFQLEAAEETVVAQVRQAGLTLRHADVRLKTTTHAFTAASRNLEVAGSLWKNGIARHSDVLDAQARVTGSQADLITAQADLILARVALTHALGLPLVTAHTPPAPTAD